MTADVPRSARRAMQNVRLGAWGHLVEWACRLGYAARGFVYVSIGVFAVLAALDLTPSARGMLGALDAWSRWPFGNVLLWLTAIGLLCFAGWRALQALADADQQGTEPKALASRAGQAISGLVYGGLAYSVFELLDAFEDLREIDDQAETRDGFARALSMPAGDWIVILIGLFIVGCGVGNLVQAVARKFQDGLAAPPSFAHKAAMLGRAGYGARGVVFLVAGTFVTLSGLHASSSEAKGTAAALQWLEHLPSGDWLMALTALGLIAFGAFAFVEARYRSLRVKELIESKVAMAARRS